MWLGSIWDKARSSGVSKHSLVLSLSKDERFDSWFDKLTTSGHVYTSAHHITNASHNVRRGRSLDRPASGRRQRPSPTETETRRSHL